MKLSVKNLGPIKSGEVDLNERFTVFVGYNNSGKTYMANVIWSFYHHYLETILNFEDKETLKHIVENNYEGSQQIDHNKIEEEFQKFIDTLPQKITDDFFINSKHPSFRDFKLNISLNSISSREYSTIWAIINDKNNPFLLKQNKGNTLFNLSLSKKAQKDSYSIKREVHAAPLNKENTSNFDSFGLISSSKGGDFSLHHLVNIFLKGLLTKTYIPYFLPANRIFFPSFLKYVYQTKKEENDTIEEKLRLSSNPADLWKIVKKPYHKNVDVLLEDLFKLESNSNGNNEYQDLLVELEKIVGGKFILKNAEGIGLTQISLQLKGGEEIDMNFASSSNNQLAVLYFYLKYFSNSSNNLLIIDEPEENLHPNHQAALAKLLVKFANRNNNKVIVTTHSSFFTDCINNYIKISQIQDKGIEVPEEVSSELLSGIKNYALKPDDFGVYFFNGEKIKPYRMREYGVFFKDFNEATKKVNDMASWLDGVIYESKHSNV